MSGLFSLLLFIQITNSFQISSIGENADSCAPMCASKSLFPMSLNEVIGGLSILIVSIIANAGGIGGSSIIITIMLTFFEFSAQEAIKFAQVSIFSGVFTLVLFKIQDRHPNNKRPLIYYDFLLVITCPLLVGVNIGLILKPALPDWAILGLLTVIMTYLFSNIVSKAIRLYKKELEESSEEERQKLLTDGDGGEESSNQSPEDFETSENFEAFQVKEFGQLKQSSCLESIDLLSYGLDAKENSNNENNSAKTEIVFLGSDSQTQSIQSIHSKQLQKIMLEESKIIPKPYLLYFASIIILNLVFSMLKNSLPVSPCNLNYFTVILAYTILMLILSIFSILYILKKHAVCVKGNYEFEHDDISWRVSTCSYISFFGLFCGIITGMLGGGNLMSPFLLSLGIRPEISTVTSSFLILLSTGTASQFLVAGDIDSHFLIYFASLSIGGSLIGTHVLRKYAIRKKKVSYLVMCTATIFFITLVCVPIIGLKDLLLKIENGEFEIGLNSVC